MNKKIEQLLEKSILSYKLNDIFPVIKEEVTIDDFKDYFDGLSSAGRDDKEKHQGMFERAKEIAAKQGKANDKPTIVGILQSFHNKPGGKEKE